MEIKELIKKLEEKRTNQKDTYIWVENIDEFVNMDETVRKASKQL